MGKPIQLLYFKKTKTNIMKNKLLLVLLILGYAPALIFAQTGNAPVINSNLKGQVIGNDTKSSLSGAVISIKGTTHQVQSDIDGNFSFKTGQKLPYIIIISHVGYETTEILAAKTDIQISLTPALKALEEVVVVGYGSQKKADITGSVASVSSNIIKQSPVSSLDRILQGAVAGVQVVQSSGQPGSSVSIRIRGGNSITGGNEPLYVIDGFPVYNDNTDANSGVTSGPSINALASLNPSDIETIDVLKDASATAIYGSRGANGVVIITTKKGKAGQNIVSYEGYYGEQKIIKTIDVLTSSKDWAKLKNDALTNAGKPAFFTPAQIEALGEGTDWQKAAFTKAPIQSHQFNFAGGDEKTRYSIGLNYFKQNGIILNSDFNRFSTRINLDRNIATNFKVGTNLTVSQISAKEPNVNIVSTLLLLPPTVSIRDAAGNYTLQSPFEVALGNPIANLEKEINQTNTFRLLGNIFGEYNLLPSLTAKVSVGADIINNKQNRYLPSSLYEAYTVNGSASVGTKFTNTFLNENTLTYTQKFGVHSLTALAGFTQQSYKSENAIASAQGFVSDLLTYNNLSSGSLSVTPFSTASEWSLKSFIGRVNYSLASKYYLTVTGRADGSSRFGKNNRWGFFPSAALAWNISRESFLKSSPFISNLKLRVSAGLTGNQEIGQYQSLATLNNNGYLIGNALSVGFAPTRLANADLSWEKTAQFDAGVDIGLFKNRINIVVDAYYKRTTELLLTVPIPYTTGYSSSLQNYGSVANKGVEIAITSNNLASKNITWNTSLVFSLNRNKILSLGQGVSYLITDPSIAQVGAPLGSFYGYQSNGIFQTSDDISKLPTIDPTNTKPGDRRYTDINGDGKITQADDRTIIGNAQPKFLAGITNNFSWKGFDATIFFYGSFGNQLFNQNRQQLELFSGQQNVASSALDRWTITNASNEVQRAKEDPAPVTTSRYIEDASYLRLKTLSLGYTLPSSITKLIRIQQVRVYASANNIANWTKYTGYDPDVSRNEQSTLSQGIDYGAYPNAKSYQVGINITF
jgi:TonB-linked SusC/RagA family outer membrane protein